MSTTLLAFFFVGSLAGIVVIVGRHLATISSLHPQELAHVKHRELKAELLLARMERLVVIPAKQLFAAMMPWMQKLAARFHRLLATLKALEHHYEKQALHRERTAKNPVSVNEQLEQLLSEAKEFFAKELFPEAERKFIAAIALDVKSIAAYEGLGELYFAKKDYDAARETYAHLVKLNERNAASHARLGAIASASGNLAEAERDYAKAAELANDLVSSHIDLGVVHEAMGKHDEALQNFLKARELEPKNPRVLDLLLHTAILLEHSSLAQDVLLALEETNPENQKLGELRERVAAMPAEILEDKKVRRKK